MADFPEDFYCACKWPSIFKSMSLPYAAHGLKIRVVILHAVSQFSIGDLLGNVVDLQSNVSNESYFTLDISSFAQMCGMLRTIASL